MCMWEQSVKECCGLATIYFKFILSCIYQPMWVHYMKPQPSLDFSMFLYICVEFREDIGIMRKSIIIACSVTLTFSSWIGHPIKYQCLLNTYMS